QQVGSLADRAFYCLPVVAEGFLASGLELRDDGEAIIGWRLREDRTVFALLKLEISGLRDRHCLGFCPIALSQGLPPCGSHAKRLIINAAGQCRRVSGLLRIFFKLLP